MRIAMMDVVVTAMEAHCIPFSFSVWVDERNTNVSYTRLSLQPVVILNSDRLQTGPRISGSWARLFTCVTADRSVRQFSSIMILTDVEGCEYIMGPFYFKNERINNTASNAEEPQMLGGGALRLTQRHRNRIHTFCLRKGT